jgi:dynein heavy chain
MQDHYDYGMRAVKTTLTAAGSLRQQFPTENEHVLILRSVFDVNLPKFLSQDVPLFRGITSDLFPGVHTAEDRHAVLVPLLLAACAQLNVQPVPALLEKILQLYDVMLVRHGLMLVGLPYSGKTTCYRVLSRALALAAEQGILSEHGVEHAVINPKAITSGQLYGQFDAVSHDWSDGVLAKFFRDYAFSTTPQRKWLIFGA